MYEGVVGIVFRIAFMIFRVFWKPAFAIMKATGTWIIAPIILIDTGFFKRPISPLWYTPSISYAIVPAIFWIGAFMAIYTTVQNITRLITGDKSYKLTTLFYRGKETNRQAGKSIAEMNMKSKNTSGVFFGKDGKQYVAKKEEEDGHILVIGGAGSGKSSCIAIPSIMTWKDRIFAIDIKGELSAKSGRSAIVFNPTDPNNQYGYDPYYLLHESSNPAQDAKEIAMCLIPLSAQIKDPFWITSAQNLLTGCILYFYSSGYSFIETLETVQTTPVGTLVELISDGDNVEAKMFINQFVGLKQETLSGIFTELSNNIMIFATDRQIKKAFSLNQTVNPTLLERGEDVFLQIPEHKLEQWKGLLSLMIQQFLKHFERRPDGTAAPVLFLLDEFARLGKVEAISNGLATLRSKKIHICILTQSLAQIDAIYGKVNRQVIADNCSYKAILKATDADTQEYFSKLVGTYEKEKITQSENFEQYTKLGKGTGKSRTTEEKRIIKPEEFAYLQDIVLLTPFGYSRIEKAPYYQDKLFLRNQSA